MMKWLALFSVMVLMLPAAFGKDLIVYLSRSQNTETVAKMIQVETGGDLLALELQNPYPEDYRATVAQVQREDESGYLPPLKISLGDLSSYERIFIGFPTWNIQLPPPIRSFLAEYDLHDKAVAPFNTHAGYGVGSGFSELANRCQGCRVLQGLSLEGGRERDGVLLAITGERAAAALAQVQAWLARLR